MARSFLVALLITIGLLFAASLEAQTTWTGATNTDWFTATNWTPAVVPNSSVTDVIIPNTANKPVVSATVSMRNLTINASATMNVTTTTATHYLYVYGTISISGTLAFNGSAAFFTYVSLYGDTVTVNAGGLLTTTAKTYAMYFRHYGNATTKSPIFTNNGTVNAGNASYYTYWEMYGDVINNSTFTNLNVYFRMYWSTTYGKQNVSIGGTTSFSCSYFQLYKYQTAAVWGTVSIDRNFSTTIGSSQSTNIYGGNLTISAGITFSTYGFYKNASSGSILTMSSSTAALNCSTYFYANNSLQENITAGTITVGASGTSYVHLQSATFNPAGGTFRVLGTTVNMTWYSGYTGMSLNDLTVGNGSTATTCNLGFSGVNTCLLTGNVTVNAASSLMHNGAGSTYLVQFNGNVVNNGTVSYSNVANVYQFGGTSALTGSGNWNFSAINVLAASTLTSSSGSISVNGVFTNSGTFNANNGTVNFISATAATLTGNTTFRNFTCTQAGKTLNFTAGSTTTISGVLTLTGATGNRILLRSTSTGTVWNINDAGTENVTAVDVRDSTATNSINAQGDSLNSGNNTNWLFPDRLTVTATAGTAQQVYANSTGTGGTGIQAGVFTIAATSGTPTLASITLMALGNADDSTAYSGVAVYQDTGGTAGAYDAGVDTIYGTEVGSFPSDNGTIQFSANLAYAASQSRTFFVVVKLNGSTLATPSQTLQTRIEACTVSGVGFIQGTPSTTMNGLTIQAPTFTYTDASAASATTAYPSSGDYVLQEFTAAYAAGPNNTITGITLDSQGSGNDLSAYSGLRLYRDANANGTYETSDTLLNTQSAFAADNGNLTFTVSQAFTAGDTFTYFVVAEFNGSPTTGNTFQCQITAGTYGYTGTTSTNLPCPAGFTAGLTIQQPSYTFADLALPAAQGTAYLGGTDFVMQTFTIAYSAGPNNTLTGITVQSSGTGDDLNDYASVKLYRDSNTSSSYEVGVDTEVATVGAFSANNGPLTFTLAGAESQFTGGSTTRYFIVVAFNLNGTNNTTFATQIQSASGQATGTTISGLVAPAAGATPGYNLLANNLAVTLNGPGTATGINNNEQGTGGIGVSICDVSLTTINAAWTVASMTFRSSGTPGNDATAYNYLALHEDSNASGAFDGGDALAVAAAGTAFAADDGDYVATLTNTAFPATTTRRFFLVAKWAGTAVTGDNFAARLQSISATPPSGGQITGAPTALAASFTINAAILSVANAPTAPASAIIEGGTAFSHSLGLFRFAATNDPVTINAITLTTTGSGDWAADLVSVELFVDNGNGTFDAGIDTQVFSGAGTTGTTVCTLTSAVNVANGTNQDIWVRLNVAATAGASVPETFIGSIANTTDVNVTGGTVAFGSPAPTTNTLSVVTFFVTTFAPIFDLQTGGAAITITGSGFLTPITLTIGGAVCSGTPVITAGGTQITGLIVPPGTGTGKVIVLTNGPLGAKTLTQTFDYAGGSTIGGAGGGGGGGGGGCEAHGGNTGVWFAALALLALASSMALRKRKA